MLKEIVLNFQNKIKQKKTVIWKIANISQKEVRRETKVFLASRIKS